MAAAHTSAYYQKTEVCIVRSGLLPFLATEGSRVIEKKVNVTQVSRTVFSLLKLTWLSDYEVCLALILAAMEEMLRFANGLHICGHNCRFIHVSCGIGPIFRGFQNTVCSLLRSDSLYSYFLRSDECPNKLKLADWLVAFQLMTFPT